jgi:chromosome partitioning protein
MGRIITVASQKGGVGKTTTTLNLGYCLSRYGSRVMIIDGDPQGGMAIASNLIKQTDKGLINLLKNETKTEDIIIGTRDKTMSVVGLGSLTPADIILLESEARTGTFGMLLKSITSGYDYIIIDAPAGVGVLPASLLSISDSVILTVNCRAISLKTIPLFLKLIKTIKEEHNQQLAFEGVLVTMFAQRIETEKQILGEIRKRFPADAFFKTMIPYNELFERASLNSVPVAMMPQGIQAARPYFELALEIKDKELHGKEGANDENIVGLF